MGNLIWKLNAIEEPSENGVYEVRVALKGDLISCPMETVMEYRNGRWDMSMVAYSGDYRVVAWRYMQPRPHYMDLGFK